MGCDIHLHVEIKIGGQWHHYSHPRINRDYELFGKMAGVRGEEQPLAEPRGLPADATFTTAFCSGYDGSDGHSHSWLSSSEVATLVAWWEERAKQHDCNCLADSFEWNRFGYLFGNSWDGFAKRTREEGGYPEALEDFRFVFWFDN